MTPDSLPPTLCPSAANDDVPVPPPIHESESRRNRTRRTMPPVELNLYESSGPSWASQIPPSSTLPETVPPMRVGGTLPPLSLSLDETALYEPSQSMPNSSAWPKATHDPEISFLPPVFVDAFSGPTDLAPRDSAARDDAVYPLAGWHFEVVTETLEPESRRAREALLEEEDSGGFRFTDPAHGAGNRSEIELTADSYRLWESYDAPVPGSLPNGAQAFFDGPVTLIDSGTHKVSRHPRVLKRKPLLGKRLWLMAAGASLGVFSVWSGGLTARMNVPEASAPQAGAWDQAGVGVGLAVDTATVAEPAAGTEEAIGGLAATSGHLLVVATPEADLDKPVRRPEITHPQAVAPESPPTDESANAGASTSPEAEALLGPAAAIAVPAGVETAIETKTDENPSTLGVKVEWGRITLPMTGGRVTRSFTLNSPPRVVVDLAGASAPLRYDQEIGEKGVQRVRIGRPDDKHVRVVVELGGARKPKRPSTLQRNGELAIAWH